MWTTNYYNYFKDGRTVVDFVLVYNKKDLKSNLQVNQLETFIQNLQKLGFKYESHPFKWDPSINFVLLNFSEHKMMKYVHDYKIGLTMDSVIYNYRKRLFRFSKNFLLEPDKNNPLFFRAPETFEDNTPTSLTSSEKVYIISEILKKTRYGERKRWYGIRGLMKSHTILTAYPLHEGSYKWTKNGPLTYRQLLYEFWAKPKRWYKEQPNNLIEKYLGTEYGYYYRWLGLYTTMLVIPAIFSVMVVLYGVATLDSEQNILSHEICRSNLLMCPKCGHCKYEYYKDTCAFSNAAYVLNNDTSTVFAIAISVWSSIVVVLWKRIEVTHQMRWNVKYLETDLSMRLQYKERANYRIIASGALEPYVPFYLWIVRQSVSFASVILWGCIIIWVSMGLRILRLLFGKAWGDHGSPYMDRDNTPIIMTNFVNAAVSTIFMILFQKMYYKIVYWITIFENSRTESEFDNSYVYKCYLLDAVNHYFNLLFTGFLKGSFYENPGNRYYSYFEEAISETCICTGCTVELAIAQFTIWATRTSYRIFTKLVVPYISVKMRTRRYKKKYRIQHQEPLQQWEDDFLLNKSEKFLVVDEYLDTLVEYGFVIYFISAFPLAPLCAFLTNIIHLRIDAFKTISLHRRPFARKVAKLTCWSKLLQFTTYLGIITNAAMISFNSDIVLKLLHKSELKNRTSLAEFTLTRFRTDQVYSVYKYKVQEEFCYFQAYRHEQDLSHTNRHWWVIGNKMMVFLAIQNLAFLVQAILYFIIPSIPYKIKVEIARQQKIRRDKSMKDREQIMIRDKPETADRFVLIK